MKIQQLRSFVSAYEERSFTAAARRLHATQSGLSMQVKELETTLGVRLFERSTTGVKPTVAGDKLYTHARTILREISAASNELEALSGEVTGTVEAGLMPTFTRGALAPALLDFAARYPYVRIKIIEAYSATLTEMVTADQLDFAIIPPPPQATTLTTRHLSQDREFLATATTTERAHLKPVRLADIKPLRLVLPSQANARRARLDAHIAANDIKVDALIEMDAMIGTLELISASDWVTILPATLCYPDIDGRRRKLHPLTAPGLTVDYVIAEPASRSMSPAARLFAEAVSDQITRIAGVWDARLGRLAKAS